MSERTITVDGEVGEGDYDVWGTIDLLLGRLLALAREGKWHQVEAGLKAVFHDYWERMSAAAEQKFECYLCVAIREYLGIPDKFV